MNKNLLAMSLLVTLTATSCARWTKPKPVIPPPLIACDEREPAEPFPRQPASNATRERWIAYARRWMGVATAEVQKRVEVADCLDRYRREGVIR